MNCEKCKDHLKNGMMRCTHCGYWNITHESENNATRLADIEASDIDRIVSGPWDPCFGGGIVRDSTVFLAGAPGAGKSSLTLGIAAKIAGRYQKVLYLNKEESMSAIRARALRFGIDNEIQNNIILVSIFKGRIKDLLRTISPALTILDSLPALVGLGAGHLDDAKEVLDDLKEYATETKAPALIIDQVNKELDFAGEMALQHLVDATIMLETDKKTDRRILRTRKNRHGAAGVVVPFTMSERGLVPVSDDVGDVEFYTIRDE